MKIFLFILLFLGVSLTAPARQFTPDSITETSSVPLIREPAEVLFQCGSEPMPQFPGGESALFNYLRQNLVFPDSALKSEVQGTVRVRFVVEGNGSISNITVTKSLGFGLDEEAIRLICNMPEWDTKNMQGKAAIFYLPVRFYPE